MRILLCLLAMVATPAWAAWVNVGENEEAIVYIDPVTIRKNGNYRKVWELYDIKKPDGGVMSRRGLWEYDCKEARVRLLSNSAHSEPMAGGKVLHKDDDDASTWGYIAPETFSAFNLKFVCTK
jgi:hypothetical protein